MTDIVERLRAQIEGGNLLLMREAASEIERLTAVLQTQGAEIDRLCELLRRALEPKP